MSYLSKAQAVLANEPTLHRARKLQVGPNIQLEFHEGHQLWEVVDNGGHRCFAKLDSALALVLEFDPQVTLPQDISILEPEALKIPQLTMSSVKEKLAPLGITLSFKAGEYNVKPRGGTEEQTYFTNDLRDALDTGRAMAKKLAK